MIMIKYISDVMEDKEIIYKFLDYIKYEKKYSDYTETNYEIDLDKYFNYLLKRKLKYDKVKYNDINDFIMDLSKAGYKSTSINRILSSLRSFYNFLERKKITSNNPFSVVSNLKTEKRLPNYFKYDEFEMMLSSIKDDEFGLRNRLILEMLFSTGIRVSELANIKLSDIDFKENSIKVFGKGNKERIVYFNNTTGIYLNPYLSESRNILLEGNSSDYLLINNKGTNLTPRGIRLIIENIVKYSSIKSKVSPHTFRHTFATIMLNEGCNIKTVQELLGHASLSTTGIYTHLTNDEVRREYLKAHPHA